MEQWFQNAERCNKKDVIKYVKANSWQLTFRSTTLQRINKGKWRLRAVNKENKT